MSDLNQSKNVEVVVTFSATSTININEICEELEIEISDIKSLNMKYCHLYVNLKDGRELEYATSAYEAEFDTKYPHSTQTYVNNVCIATNRAQLGGAITLEPSEPLMYVLSVRQYGSFEPVFASLRRYECEAQAEKYDTPTRIEAVPSPHGL